MNSRKIFTILSVTFLAIAMRAEQKSLPFLSSERVIPDRPEKMTPKDSMFMVNYSTLMAKIASSLPGERAYDRGVKSMDKFLEEKQWSYELGSDMRDYVNYQLFHRTVYGIYDPYFYIDIRSIRVSDIPREMIDKLSALFSADVYASRVPNAAGLLYLIPDSELTDYDKGLGYALSNHATNAPEKEIFAFLKGEADKHELDPKRILEVSSYKPCCEVDIFPSLTCAFSTINFLRGLTKKSKMRKKFDKDCEAARHFTTDYDAIITERDSLPGALYYPLLQAAEGNEKALTFVLRNFTDAIMRHYAKGMVHSRYYKEYLDSPDDSEVSADMDVITFILEEEWTRNGFPSDMIEVFRKVPVEYIRKNYKRIYNESKKKR